MINKWEEKSNYSNILYHDYESLQKMYDDKCNECKQTLLRAIIAEDNEARLQKQVDKQEEEIKALKAEKEQLQKEYVTSHILHLMKNF